jgi:hypothetical protein
VQRNALRQLVEGLCTQRIGGASDARLVSADFGSSK